METRFQTSFIPRKPLVSNSPIEPKKGSTSVFLIISFVILLLSVGSALGVTTWKKIVEKSIVSKKDSLELRKAQFGSDIDFLKRFNTKITSAKKLIDNHLAVTTVFDIISSITVEDVRFKSFDFSIPTEGEQGSVTLNLKGEAASFAALASQSDELAKNKTVKDPIVTDMVLAENGLVSFTFSGILPTSAILFKDLFINTENTATSTGNIVLPVEDISNPNQ